MPHDGVYQVDPERVEKAFSVIRRCLSELSADDVAGILGEVGMWECVVWTNVDLGQITLLLSDLQTIAAAAALASGLDGIKNAPIEMESVRSPDEPVELVL